MTNTLTIARREFSSFFFSPIAYVVMCVFVLLASLMFLMTTFALQDKLRLVEGRATGIACGLQAFDQHRKRIVLMGHRTQHTPANLIEKRRKGGMPGEVRTQQNRVYEVTNEPC